MQDSKDILDLVSPENQFPQSLAQTTSLSLEELVKNAIGLSYVARMMRSGENGKKEVYWQAVGSWGRGNQTFEGATIYEAIGRLSAQPYHLDPSLGRKKDIPTTPSDEDLFVRALALMKTEEELLEEANIRNIKYNWEIHQALPCTSAWTVMGGTGKNAYPYAANLLRDALAKAWVFGTLGIKKIGEDEEHYYLADYLPGLGVKNIAQDHFGYSGLETIVRKADIQAMLQGEKEKMFQ